MSTDLSKLRVSLTKHGAHKVAYLIKKFDKDDILNHLSGDYHSINIDYAQARKILSAGQDGIAPELWNRLRQYGEEDISDVVFISNVFSHVDLINTMIRGIEDNCVIKRGSVIDGKAYTNFAHTIDQFGYSIEHTPDYVSFDLSRIFHKFYLSKFIYEIISTKLTEAGWDGENDLITECQTLGLNKVFGLSTDDFHTWLQGNLEADETKLTRTKAIRDFHKGIKFRKGHRTKYAGRIEIKPTDRRTALLLHNEIQNKVFAILSSRYPNEVGTEIQSNTGTIDIVRESKGSLTFYEIKTTQDVKINIRQALSQLLEYAYWNRIEGVEELVIVSPGHPTSDAVGYIQTLRSKFGMPIYYQYFNVKDGILGDPL